MIWADRISTQATEASYKLCSAQHEIFARDDKISSEYETAIRSVAKSSLPSYVKHRKRTILNMKSALSLSLFIQNGNTGQQEDTFRRI